jgi:hypothetical protein
MDVDDEQQRVVRLEAVGRVAALGPEAVGGGDGDDGPAARAQAEEGGTRPGEQVRVDRDVLELAAVGGRVLGGVAGVEEEEVERHRCAVDDLFALPFGQDLPHRGPDRQRLVEGEGRLLARVAGDLHRVDGGLVLGGGRRGGAVGARHRGGGLVRGVDGVLGVAARGEEQRRGEEEQQGTAHGGSFGVGLQPVV